MKYIITGGSGLIGKALETRLLKLGHECIENFDLKTGKDVKDIKHFKTNKKIDCIFHLAANVKINKCVSFPELAKENVDGVFEALEYCRKNKINKFIYFSSSRVLSSERNSYVASKIYGEELCKAYHDCYGIDYLIIRPSTVYGPGKDESKRLIDVWINNARDNKDLIINGNLTKTLCFTYIDDFIDGVIEAMDNYNREYNIAGSEEYLIDVANEIKKITSSKSKIRYKKTEIAQPQKVYLKSDFECKTTIRDGIKKCLI